MLNECGTANASHGLSAVTWVYVNSRHATVPAAEFCGLIDPHAVEVAVSPHVVTKVSARVSQVSLIDDTSGGFGHRCERLV